MRRVEERLIEIQDDFVVRIEKASARIFEIKNKDVLDRLTLCMDTMDEVAR